MKDSNMLLRLVVSLYVVLFVFAVWSVVPSTSTGLIATEANMHDSQITSSELNVGTAGAEAGSYAQQKEMPSTGTLASARTWSWSGVKDVYLCALLMGAAYN